MCNFTRKIRLKRKHRAVVTVLDDEPKTSGKNNNWTLAGSMELVDDDLETASREIADEINRAIERSSEELRKSL